MTVVMKRQLNDDEKQQILKQHGRRCWATGMDIPEDDKVHFDHIHPFAKDGASELQNIAPMSAECNRQKSTLSLDEFRVKLRLHAFFKDGDRLTLGDLLAYMKVGKDIQDFGRDVSISEEGDKLSVKSMEEVYHCIRYTCPATGWHYFYATLPVSLIESDDDRDKNIGLQPRYLIFDKVFSLYRHFNRHPVLQPSIGRLVGNKIRIFDGQHKIAGLLWAGRRDFECKIYLDPDIRLLNQTNISAHDKFAQTRFYSSIMVMKLGGQFGSDFEEYKNTDDGNAKSEAGFLKWLSRKEANAVTKGDLNKQFKSYIYNAIIDDETNKFSRFISASNRSTDEKPVTIDQLSKSFFSNFVYAQPVEDNMATDEYKRDQEVANNVALLNIFYELAMHSWNPKVGDNDENQRRLRRLFRSKSAMAWSEILKDAVCAKLNLQDSEDRTRPFYRELTDEQLTRVKEVVNRLLNWKWWSASANDDIDRILSDNKSEVKAWFKDHGLTTGYLLGATE